MADTTHTFTATFTVVIPDTTQEEYNQEGWSDNPDLLPRVSLLLSGDGSTLLDLSYDSSNGLFPSVEEDGEVVTQRKLIDTRLVTYSLNLANQELTEAVDKHLWDTYPQ